MLLRLLVDAIKRGWRDANGSFNKLTIEKKILSVLNQKLGSEKNYSHYKNRMKILKARYQSYVDLFRHSSGFGWDPVTKKFTASNEVWNDYFKGHSNQSHLRDNSFEDYEDLNLIFGSNTATGKNAIGLSDSSAQPSETHDMNPLEEDQGATYHHQVHEDVSFSSLVTEISNQVFGILQQRWKQEAEEKQAEEKINCVWDAIKEIPDLEDDVRYDAMTKVHELGMKAGFAKMSITERFGWIKRHVYKS
ncbi:unnamed protein product [Thlaspi arvense]|uniref:Myb/SANT-like domain-containing protein n=1 Tax=Thlaspi arvense TaxID=13288 RepID=A0AAU9R7N2_THLAR|nr:unnamed protein product [Thlaspi arvense]